LDDSEHRQMVRASRRDACRRRSGLRRQQLTMSIYLATVLIVVFLGICIGVAMIKWPD
jgi:hypothetical protein